MGKLVRDKIQNENVVELPMDDDGINEFHRELYKKFMEEFNELMQASTPYRTIEEMSDLLEVSDSLLANGLIGRQMRMNINVSLERLANVRQVDIYDVRHYQRLKFAALGGFNERKYMRMV